MLNKTEKIFSNNKDLNLNQPLPKDEIFMSNVIQIPHHINKNLLEEGITKRRRAWGVHNYFGIYHRIIKWKK